MPANALETKAMDMVDFVVDAKSLIGQRVTITSCGLENASSMVVMCAAKAGVANIDPDTFAREDLRRSLRQCSGYAAPPECKVAVTGTIATTLAGGVILRNAEIDWPK
jgi:hypothetical protein